VRTTRKPLTTSVYASRGRTSPDAPARACALCDSAFRGRGRYCSIACREQGLGIIGRRRARLLSRVDRSPRTCAECHGAFVPAYGTRRRRYCSEGCLLRTRQRIRSSRRRAKRKAAKQAGALKCEPLNPLKVFERDGWVCHLCGDLTLPALRGTTHGFAPELDHVVPLAQGGTHTWDNVACSHRVCNWTKGDQLAA
jgi:5-methylcytosine-specific restriction endonuclease McrA